MAPSVVGLGLASPPVQLSNTINAISQKYIVPVLGDNVMRPSPVFWALTREGKKFAGGELIFPEITQEELPGGAYYGDQLLDTSVVDSIAPADQQWKPYRQPIVIPVTDIILNRGGAGNLDLIKAKYQVASASFLQKLSRALWHTSPQNTSLDVDDLVSFIGLPHDIALKGDADEIKHRDGIESPSFEIGLAQADRDLWQAGRRLNLDVGGAGDLAHRAGDLLRLLIEDVEIIAENIDDDRRGITRQRFLDAFGEKRHDRRIHAD